MQDKFTATWVSHSSISDFLKCPRAYYLNNVYKNPQTGRKINLTSPPLALGQIVHQVIESLSILPVNKRFKEPLVTKLEKIWPKISGKKGGFLNKDTEYLYKQKAKDMLNKLTNNPGPLNNLAVKIQQDLPNYWLSENEGIILCGKIDWLEYLKDQNAVHIIDFKTGKAEEDPNSLQLPIYHLLVHNCQNRQAAKASYWYIQQAKGLQEKKLPDLKKAHQQILSIAKKIKLARQLEIFKCPHHGCGFCQPLEAIINGQAEMVGIDEYNREIYVLNTQSSQQTSRLL